MKTFCTKYGYPDTRTEVAHEPDECAACRFVSDTVVVEPGREGLIFVEMEGATAAEPTVIKRLAIVEMLGLTGTMCRTVTREEADKELADGIAAGHWTGDDKPAVGGSTASQSNAAIIEAYGGGLDYLDSRFDPMGYAARKGSEFARVAAGKPAKEVCGTCGHAPFHHAPVPRPVRTADWPTLTQLALGQRGKCTAPGCKCAACVAT